MEKQISIPQLVLAWLSSKGDDLITLVGASRRTTLLDSMKSVNIQLNAEEINRVEQAIPESKISGGSFPKIYFRNGVRI
ncbi:aldo/keto reductase [Cohnella rhizosphaerae]|uniref:NADP-dependent oxidoreductase domain-containing protein n=1 Tax=Cohnella rhizosphaerae TaxID=1457232 RepID=A0A9X4KZ20_9BACL|nr:aldo/keto reductase [Cohnella rhizosphaerae]MDG0813485.1 hypothetical protein [Cohnella rhizosphaerae]